MRTVTDLIDLFNEELGLGLGPDTAGLPLEALPGWDSMLLLRAVGVLEAALGRQVPVADLLTAGSLEEIHALAVPA
ncbi:phosphopantetheine-binding protein [Kitasatospora sp. NPDC059571]|uniref:phosphopantetheine-binding protein n=1 Tax=Kitasatospora sp. NPDC059571 TaxID=3346871 RepID=UPI0036B41B2D